jgi:hypothetical protein
LAGISEPLQDGTNDGHGKNRTTNGRGNVQSSIDVVNTVHCLDGARNRCFGCLPGTIIKMKGLNPVWQPLARMHNLIGYMSTSGPGVEFRNEMIVKPFKKPGLRS